MKNIVAIVLIALSLALTMCVPAPDTIDGMDTGIWRNIGKSTSIQRIKMSQGIECVVVVRGGSSGLAVDCYEKGE